VGLERPDSGRHWILFTREGRRHALPYESELDRARIPHDASDIRISVHPGKLAWREYKPCDPVQGRLAFEQGLREAGLDDDGVRAVYRTAWGKIATRALPGIDAKQTDDGEDTWENV
jgi:hypothetical protein